MRIYKDIELFMLPVVASSIDLFNVSLILLANIGSDWNLGDDKVV